MPNLEDLLNGGTLNEPNEGEDFLSQPNDFLPNHGTRKEVLVAMALNIEELSNHGWHDHMGCCTCLIPDMLRAMAGEPYNGDDVAHRPWCDRND